jgi:hypothetical protein
MKTIILSAFVVFGPLVGTVLAFLPTVRRELCNLKEVADE